MLSVVVVEDDIDEKTLLLERQTIHTHSNGMWGNTSARVVDLATSHIARAV